jgi:predicted secreted hydrolase
MMFALLFAVTFFAACLISPLSAAAQVATPTAAGDPVSIAFPVDEGPHAQPFEWWYYTAHIATADGDRYGFEFVVFKASEAGLWFYASHFAVTDGAAGTFQYDQRQELAPPDANEPSETGFDLALGDWSVSGLDGNDRLVASLPDYAIDLSLTSQKPPVLHDGDGFVDFGGGASSYYYSRTRIAVEGTLTINGAAVTVSGDAWFDHQWGDFLDVIAGGWDWYAIQLDDETELMLYVTRDQDGEPAWVHGSYIDANGGVTALAADTFQITATGEWSSPATGITYPSGWIVDVLSLEMSLTLTPVLRDQELDTMETTRVIYWEGQVTVSGTRAGAPISGLGYVELNGYE